MPDVIEATGLVKRYGDVIALDGLVTLAARQQFGNAVPGAPTPEVWSLQHPIVYTTAWAVVIVAVFLPLSVRQYKRSASR